VIHSDKDDPSRNDVNWMGLSAAEYYGPKQIVVTFDEPLPPEAHQRAISIFYTNHRGVKRKRHVIPLHFIYGISHPWYQKPQWLMIAYDLGKEAWRIFALDNVSGWNPNFRETEPHVEGAGAKE
jgi:hypothetical protein